MIEFTIDKGEAGMTIKQYLKTKHQFSRRLMTRLTKEDNSILVNHKERRIDYRLQAKDTLTINFPKETIAPRLIAEQIPLDIVYEDEHLLMINKPPNIAVMPSFNHQTGTIANAVLGYYEQRQLPYTVHVVTRLDRNTSGLMLIAKHQYSHSLFSHLIERNLLERKYIAIVQGKMNSQVGTINIPIGRVEGSIVKRTVIKTGKQAITHFNVERVIDNYSVVHIQLETGRTHQIRVHFSSIGHPLVGDDLYGNKSEQINRQALHCHQLQFIHPITKKSLTFHAKLPDDMQRLIN